MSDKQLYCVTALFDSPDEIIRAASETAKAGYVKFDVNTPYPVHGMDGAMKLKPTRLGFFTLAFGLLGAFSAIGFMTWVTLIEYPLVIGGKPFWSWPAFVPVSFELTVLMASVLSVAAMIVIYFKFPNNSHPLHDTRYMKAVSSDRFGIHIEADDPLFEEKGVVGFFRSLGSKDVVPVYFDEEELNHGLRLFDPKFIGILAAVAVISSGTVYFIFNQLMFMPPFNWMMTQEKLKAQKPAELFADGIGMRKPVEGTVARGFLPYRFKGEPDSAGKYMMNPLLPTEEVTENGRGKYLTFCSPCHGNFGRGDSRLRGQFPNPPTLHSDKVRNFPDGNIYHIITEGQNVMPPYASQISRDDRWAIVHYVRALQRAHNAGKQDLK